MAEAEEEGTDTKDLENAFSEADSDHAVTVEEAAAAKGPGFLVRALSFVQRWHPFIFLGAALGLAVMAWSVYPEPQTREIPGAEFLYADGLDRLYRVINPDLPLVAATAGDEALAARNAFLNLFVFHRANLGAYPRFVNPHLLLAEANRVLAEYNPPLADKFYGDAALAYNDAALWERRETAAADLAAYVDANFLNGKAGIASGHAELADVLAFFDKHAEEIALRRSRREEYIRFRLAEADVFLGKPELARQPLEDIQRRVDDRRRESVRRSLGEVVATEDLPRNAFELGPDEYRRLDLLLAKAYDGLGMTDQAKVWYLRYLPSATGGRDHAMVVERIAGISLQDGEVYRQGDPERAVAAYMEAERYFQELYNSPSAERAQMDNAALGLATANSRLASLVEAGPATGVDELVGAGRTLLGWLEEFSGQPLPQRTLAVPGAVGKTLASPELISPGGGALAGAVAGSLLEMAGGGVITPHERRRTYLVRALENYDRLAAILAEGEDGDRARIMAARESWNLGRKDDAEERLQRLLDPLSSEGLLLAARIGLADIAIDRGDLRRAHILVRGGYAHPHPLWFTANDADWRRIAARLGNSRDRGTPGVWRRVWETIPEEGREIAGYAASGRRLDDVYVGRFLRALNTMLRDRGLYRAEDFPPNNRDFHLEYLLSRNPELLTGEDVVWRNRLLLEEAWPYDLFQRASVGNVGFPPFPPSRGLHPGGLVGPDRVRDTLLRLARAWFTRAAAASDVPERLRMMLECVDAYEAALTGYGGDPGDIHYELAQAFEALADIREIQGNHAAALAFTAAAARHYQDVSERAPGNPREIDALLAAGDAFFRAGLLERTVESQRRFMERFGFAAMPGSDTAMAVVRAENLLGRAYWFLGDVQRAVEAFKRNIPRRTPDRFKSIYYIGRVLMEQGLARNDASLLGDSANPLPNLDQDQDPIVDTALQAFNFLRQSPGINPTARAWRWATFDHAQLQFQFAERERRRALAPPPPVDGAAATAASAPAEVDPETWLGMYDTARFFLTEALERYPLRRNGGVGLSVRVEPEDYADVMASRFETEYSLANTLLRLAEGREDESLYSLARAHLENLRDVGRYAEALFDTSLDRFQVNAAVIREEIEGGVWERDMPLPRTRLGDDEGPTHSPARLRDMLRNGMLLLANEYFLAGERAAAQAAADEGQGNGGDATGFYRRSYEAYQSVYDRFGMEFGSQAMVGMGDALSRLGNAADAANHYRMARNIAELQPADTRSDGRLDIGPGFWSRVAASRLRDIEGGYAVP